jgi:hypothetical protein
MFDQASGKKEDNEFLIKVIRDALYAKEIQP